MCTTVCVGGVPCILSTGCGNMKNVASITSQSSHYLNESQLMIKEVVEKQNLQTTNLGFIFSMMTLSQIY